MSFQSANRARDTDLRRRFHSIVRNQEGRHNWVPAETLDARRLVRILAAVRGCKRNEVHVLSTARRYVPCAASIKVFRD